MKFGTASVLLAALGACADPPPVRRLPGPCVAVMNVDARAVYGYDALGRRISFDYEAAVDTSDPAYGMVSWTWNDDGTLAAVEGRIDGLLASDEVWTFGADSVTEVAHSETLYGTEVHELDVTFLGDPDELVGLLDLRAPDSVTRSEPEYDVAVDYTYDGPPRQGTRTRTGSDGSVSRFTYDPSGALAMWEDDAEVTTFRREAGELVEVVGPRATTVLERDEFGNLMRVTQTRPNGRPWVTTYGYGCW